MTDTPSDVLADRLKHDSPAPADCSDDELAQADFTRRDVLVGTLRSDAQFDYAMASLSYYAPVRTIPPSDLPVRVIALYEEAISRRAGIKRYGRVNDIRVVRREDIPVPQSRPNPEEAYYLFTVDSWEFLEHPIAIEGTARGKPAFTAEFLLTHARRSYQLVSIRSAAEYRLTQILCQLREEAETTPVTIRRLGDQRLLCAADGFLSLVHARGEVPFRCPLSALQTEPAQVLHQLAVLLGLRER
jgi:hypothetical protein